jgi:hypothetical protein
MGLSHGGAVTGKGRDVMIFAAVALLAAAFFLFRRREEIATAFGGAVAARRWEVDNSYAPAELSHWFAANPQEAAGYASVLFPWDMTFAAYLGLGLAPLCYALGRYLGLSAGYRLALLVLPLAFAGLDLSEDQILRGFFAGSASISDAAAGALVRITGAKFLTVWCVLAQAALLLLAAGVVWAGSALKSSRR